MGIFNFGKKEQKKQKEIISAPVRGKAVASSEINDPTFAQELLGKGMAIKPTEGKVYSPVEGKIATIFETKHALSIISNRGTELLIHVGLDTVALKGQFFEAYVKEGTEVKRGELLLEFELLSISEAGYDTIVPIVICNTADYEKVTCMVNREVEPGDPILEVEKIY
ncbi:MAG: PTS glucose transporter subunit IIA [Lachnospiraceae bacterium]|nr:PTS glucose transporter subunit IIA [Lachnospiraceae bacterium]